jgi:hypothetical protein
MDIGASNWSETDTNNNQPAPDGAPEGMFPSGVNDTIRAVMGALKRWFNWSSPKITGGSATAYTLTYGVVPSALVDGMTHLVQFHAVNGAGATLNVNGLGAKPLYAYSGGAWYQAPPAFVDVASVCRVIYDAGAGAYRLLMPGAVPTGSRAVRWRGGAGRISAGLRAGDFTDRLSRSLRRDRHDLRCGQRLDHVQRAGSSRIRRGRQGQHGRRHRQPPEQRDGQHDAWCRWRRPDPCSRRQRQCVNWRYGLGLARRLR